MKLNRYSLSVLWFYIVVVAAAFILENYNFLSSSPMDGMPFSTIVAISVIFLAFAFIYYFTEFNKAKSKIDVVLLPILLIFGGLCTFRIWTVGDMTFIEDDVTNAVTFTNENLWTYTIQLWVGLIALYGMLYFFLKEKISFRKMSWAYYLIIFLVLLSIVLTYIQNFEDIKLIINRDPGNEPLSFWFHNPNSFAYFISLGILSLIVLNSFNRHFWTYPLLILFSISLIFTYSSTCLICFGGLAIIYFFIDSFLYIKRNKKWGLISFGVYLSLFIAFIVLLFTLGKEEGNFFCGIRDLLEEMLLKKDWDTLTHRTDIWEMAWNILKEDPMALAFGYGFKTSKSIIGAASTVYLGTSFRSLHNAFFEVVFSTGLIGLTLYVLLILYSFYCLICSFINKRYRFSITFLLIEIAVLIHGFTESYVLFNISDSGVITTLLFILPGICEHKHHLHKETLPEAKYVKSEPMDAEKLSSFVFLVLMSLAVISFLAYFFVPQIKDNPQVSKWFLLICIFSATATLYIPYHIEILKNTLSNIRFYRSLLLEYLILILTFAGIFALSFYFPTINHYLVLMLYGSMTFASLIYFIVYTCVKGLNVIHWIKSIVHNLLKVSLIPLLVSFIFGAFILTLGNLCWDFDLVSNIFTLILAMMIYYLTFIYLPFSDSQYVQQYLNEEVLKTYSYYLYLDEIGDKRAKRRH